MNCSIEGCGDKYYGRGYCKKHHQWRWARGLLPKLKMPTLAERIESRIEPITESGCWIWIGSVNNRGYGVTSLNGEHMYVHRAMYEMHRGKIPDDFEICHKCDVPACVNPNHMFLGTHLENMRDSRAKGRNWKGFTYPQLAERIKRKSVIDAGSGCWLHQGFRDSRGYSKIGTKLLAHRVMYIVSVGPIPKGQCVRRKCGHLNCCNPAHMFVEPTWAAVVRFKKGIVA